jgi:hypothetical protein
VGRCVVADHQGLRDADRFLWARLFASGVRVMGTSYRYTCGGCGYEAQASGGRDVGGMAVVQTMVFGPVALCVKFWR